MDTKEKFGCSRLEAALCLFLVIALPFVLSNWLRQRVEVGEPGLIAVAAILLVASIAIVAFLILVILGVGKQPKTVLLAALAVGLVLGGGLTGYRLLSVPRLTSYGDEFWSQALRVCDGIGIPEAAAYQETPGLHKVVAVEPDAKTWWSWTQYIQKEWRPTSLADTELIVCLEPEKKISIEVCHYQGSFTQERYQYTRHAVLRSARTGEVISSADLEGGMPAQCPRTTSKDGTIAGFPPGEAQASEWLIAFVSR